MKLKLEKSWKICLRVAQDVQLAVVENDSSSTKTRAKFAFQHISAIQLFAVAQELVDVDPLASDLILNLRQDIDDRDGRVDASQRLLLVDDLQELQDFLMLRFAEVNVIDLFEKLPVVEAHVVAEANYQSLNLLLSQLESVHREHATHLTVGDVIVVDLVEVAEERRQLHAACLDDALYAEDRVAE